MPVISALKRWSTFLEGISSVAAAAALAGFRVLSPVTLSWLRVPLRVEGMDAPVYCRPGTSDFHTLLQIWDQDEYRLSEEFVGGPVRQVLDLGSNIGLSVRYFAALWPEARIGAVEPDPENVALARANLAGLVRAGRVDIHHCFVGRERGYAAPVRDEGAGHNEIRIGERSDARVAGSVPVRTVPELLREFSEEPIDFLKCDIEGSERMLFEGGPVWLRRVKAFVVELHRLEVDWLWECVREAGMAVEDSRIQPVSGYDYTVVWARIRRARDSGDDARHDRDRGPR